MIFKLSNHLKIIKEFEKNIKNQQIRLEFGITDESFYNLLYKLHKKIGFQHKFNTTPKLLQSNLIIMIK